jgi:hypothetical protein
VSTLRFRRPEAARVELLDAKATVASSEMTNGGWALVANARTHDILVALGKNGKIVESFNVRSWT